MPLTPTRHQEGDVIIYRVALSDDIRPRFWVVVFLPILWIAVMLLLLIDWRSDQALSVQGWCTIPIAVFISGVLIAWAPQAQDTALLRFDASGLTYEGSDFTATTTWKNIECVREGPMPRLILRERALVGTALFRDAGWYVPLERFQYTHHSALADDLRRFVPHLYHS